MYYSLLRMSIMSINKAAEEFPEMLLNISLRYIQTILFPNQRLHKLSSKPIVAPNKL